MFGIFKRKEHEKRDSAPVRRLDESALPVWLTTGLNPHDHQHESIGGRHAVVTWRDHDGFFFAVAYTARVDEDGNFPYVQSQVYGPGEDRDWLKMQACADYVSVLDDRQKAALSDLRAVRAAIAQEQ